MGKIVFWQGNRAVAMGAIMAGVRFYAGYPITPSSEIAEILSAELPKVGGIFIQMEDEIGSMAAAIGASLAGLKSMTATSGPGFSLKQENIGFAIMAEVPVVVVDVQRGGPSTGTPTKPFQGDFMQARWGSHGGFPLIVLSPSTVKECFDLTIEAVNLAERFRSPVILLTDEIVGHMREKMEIPEEYEVKIVNRKKPSTSFLDYRPYRADPEDDIPPMAAYGEGYCFHVTGLVHDEYGLPTNDPKVIEALNLRLLRKFEKGKDLLVKFSTFATDDADVLVVAFGCVARSAMGAIREARKLGYKVGLFRPVMLWPFPDEPLREAASKVKAIIVPEMNPGLMVREVERAIRGKCEVYSLLRLDTEMITPGQILEKIKEVV
ncbi:MAG: 2-oxoacid:acceptor oxidoreductase subunit alpha [Synergistetes bacterium]|nr:2-oxoacid:acceptor oxidoreductase subunit alpha [Synergistota bacterium]MDW8191462.1 2-oxoacid:acceptor oxidoreductase subunit alpha [Synergistota bacterium]